MGKKFNIIFMGTPDFAVPALAALSENNYNIRLVVTQPDRPRGRGRKVLPSPVKKEAMHLGYELCQPESVNTEDFYKELEKLKPDFIVVAAYGTILSKTLLSLAQIAALNIHPSLLPKYRGPAPVQHALINDEKETGVCIMMLDAGLDTGDILLCEKESIETTDTFETLQKRLAEKGAQLLVKALKGFKNNTIKSTPQNDKKATYAPLLKKKDGLINWNTSSEKLSAFVRGMNPWPGAFTFLNHKRFKIFKLKPASATEAADPGTVLKSFNDELRVSTKTGAVSVLEVQSESGKRLQVRDFLRGCSISPGTKFSSNA